jgi:hypothetical protein
MTSGHLPPLKVRDLRLDLEKTISFLDGHLLAFRVDTGLFWNIMVAYSNTVPPGCDSK